MKTLESIREEIWEEMLRLEDKRKDRWADIKYQTLREVLQKLGHLDEPEVLSQEWIDENEELEEMYGSYGVPVHKLQNLLVPKQEREQKYYVDLDTAAYVAKWDGNDQVDIYTDGISGSDEFEFHLTEQEIKDYDERFWPFAVKIEELEE